MLFWAALLLLLQHKHRDLPGIWDKDLDFGLNTTFTPRELSRVGLEAFHRAARVQSRSATILYRASTATLLHFRLSLLFMSGNIESNPSPQYKFPCGVCSKPVKTSQKSICCDSCDRWYHTQCCSVGDHIYDTLANSSCSWICCDCGLPNFSDSLFSTSMEWGLNNSFSSLSSTDSDLSNHLTPSSNNEHLSSQRERKQNLRKLKVLNLNCNGIRSQHKSGLFKAKVEDEKPHIMIGTESKLDE